MIEQEDHSDVAAEPEEEEYLGTLRWFGTTWHAPVCDPRTHIETPVGLRCARCEEIIIRVDRGITLVTHPKLAWHRDCWLRELGVDQLFG